MSPLLLALLLILIISTFRAFLHPRYRLPPGPKPRPVIGNLLDVKPPVFRCMAEWSQMYGPVTSFWLGSSLNVYVCDSQLAKEVLKENDQHLANRPRSAAISFFTNDGKDLTWADYGPHYVKLRKFCTLELFSPRRIQALRPIWEDETATMVRSISKECTSHGYPGKYIILRDHLKEVVFNSITRMVLGKRFLNAGAELNEQGKEFKAIMANKPNSTDELMLGILEHFPWLRWISWLKKGDAEKEKARRGKVARAILEEHRTTRGKNKSADEQHFVGALLALEAEYEFDEDSILGLLWDLISAGADTSATAVEWAMAEVIRNTNIQRRVQEELNHVVRSDCLITGSDMSKLRYLQCVVKEVLRLHPPTPLMLPHKASKNVKIGGYDVPQGSNVHVNVWAIARSPENWQDPLEFRPERFLGEDIDLKGNDLRLLPFGSGRRVCPGAQLGIEMVTSMLGHLLHQFYWSLPQGVKPEEVDMLENPGLVSYMRTPFEAVATPRLPFL